MFANTLVGSNLKTLRGSACKIHKLESSVNVGLWIIFTCMFLSNHLSVNKLQTKDKKSLDKNFENLCRYHAWLICLSQNYAEKQLSLSFMSFISVVIQFGILLQFVSTHETSDIHWIYVF